MITRKGLSRRLRNLGVESHVANLISEKWQLQVKARGPEGAVAYLKRVGDTLLWFLTASGEKPDWVKVSKTGFPEFLSGCENLPVETLVRISKLARTIVLDKPSDSQIGKVLPAVVTPFTGDPTLLDVVSSKLYNLAENTLPVDLEVLNRPSFPLLLQQWRRVQSVSGKTPVMAEPPLAESLSILKQRNSFKVVSAIPNWESMFQPITPKSLDQMIRVTKGKAVESVGEIHATQEGGAKLRMFASPFTVYQCLLTPLHEFLVKVRKHLQTDCTYDQESGAIFAQQAMQKGLVVHSVDLSTATCRFPLELQISVLKGLSVPQEWIDLLVYVCQGHWEVDEDLQPYFEAERIQWQVGQPLGIRPSMSLFSLTHNLLLTWLCHRAGVKPVESFRVLGDDVVIVGDGLHSCYREVITQLGVPISESKSHSSSAYAEFAGYSIFPNLMVRPGQWRELDFLNFKEMSSQLTNPSVPEGNPILIKLVRFLRWKSGELYVGGPELEKYQQASLLLESSGWDWKEHYFKSEAPLWCVKVEEYVRKTYPNVDIRFYGMRFPTASRLLRRMDAPLWLRNYAFHMDEFQVDTGDPIVFQGFLLCCSLYAAITAGNTELSIPFDDAVQIISENTNAELWQPPAKRRRSVSADFAALVGALRSSGLVA